MQLQRRRTREGNKEGRKGHLLFRAGFAVGFGFLLLLFGLDDFGLGFRVFAGF